MEPHLVAEPEAKFALGQICVTRKAAEFLAGDEPLNVFLLRHSVGDWGDIAEEEKVENDLALHKGIQLISVYHDRKGTEFWVLTEADRSRTTVALYEELHLDISDPK